MTVVVDGSVFEHHGNLGIWRIFYEVLGRIGSELDIVLWLRSPPVRPIPEGVRILQDSARHYCPRYDLLARARRSLSRRRIPPAVRFARLFHPTFMTRAPVASLAEVTTVYDMIQEKCYAISGGWALEHIEAKRQSVSAARVCLCISHATADDLTRFYPAAAPKMSVCTLGAEHLLGGEELAPAATPPFVLFVGARGGHKNFVTLLEAMTTPSWPRNTPLWAVGTAGADYEIALVRYHGLGDQVRFLGPVSDVELKRLYRSALCFVYPSVCEGFGLPVLEAQTNASPVAVSDIPAFREVGSSESTVYFDPRSPLAIATGVAEAAYGKGRLQRIEAGQENVKRFRWADCATAHVEMYRVAMA